MIIANMIKIRHCCKPSTTCRSTTAMATILRSFLLETGPKQTSEPIQLLLLFFIYLDAKLFLNPFWKTLCIDSRSFLFVTILVGPCWPNDRMQVFRHYCTGFIFETVHPSFYTVYARNIETNYKWFLLKCDKMDDCVPLSSVTMMWLSPPDPSGSVLM